MTKITLFDMEPITVLRLNDRVYWEPPGRSVDRREERRYLVHLGGVWRVCTAAEVCKLSDYPDGDTMAELERLEVSITPEDTPGV